MLPYYLNELFGIREVAAFLITLLHSDRFVLWIFVKVQIMNNFLIFVALLAVHSVINIDQKLKLLFSIT